MIRRLFCLAVLLAAAAPLSAREFMGMEVIDMPFAVAGGEVMMLPVTDGGVIPAEDDRFRVEVAGFQLARTETGAALAWGFTITAKQPVELESVEVVEIAPSDTAKPWLLDSAPTVRDGVWTSTLAPVALSPETVPWFYEEKASIFVFRIIVREKGLEPVVLHQPAWFSREAKAQLRDIAAKWGG